MYEDYLLASESETHASHVIVKAFGRPRAATFSTDFKIEPSIEIIFYTYISLSVNWMLL
jgi:hypothetical protein